MSSVGTIKPRSFGKTKAMTCHYAALFNQMGVTGFDSQAVGEVSEQWLVSRPLKKQTIFKCQEQQCSSRSVPQSSFDLGRNAPSGLKRKQFPSLLPIKLGGGRRILPDAPHNLSVDSIIVYARRSLIGPCSGREFNSPHLHHFEKGVHMSTGKRGFGSMDPAKQKEISRKGGLRVSRDRAHMSRIGKKGGETSALNRQQEQEDLESFQKEEQKEQQ